MVAEPRSFYKAVGRRPFHQTPSKPIPLSICTNNEAPSEGGRERAAVCQMRPVSGALSRADVGKGRVEGPNAGPGRKEDPVKGTSWQITADISFIVNACASWHPPAPPVGVLKRPRGYYWYIIHMQRAGTGGEGVKDTIIIRNMVSNYCFGHLYL